MKKILFIVLLFLLCIPLTASRFPLTETLEPEFQSILPPWVQLARVQHLGLPDLPRAVMVTYMPMSAGKEGPEADAVLLARGKEGAHTVWQARPVRSWPEPYSVIYNQKPANEIPVYLFCHTFGASVGTHMEAYRWTGKTFKPVGLKPLDGFETLKVKFLLGKGENMVVAEGRYQLAYYLIYRKGRLVDAPRDYVQEYDSMSGKNGFRLLDHSEKP
jgi:hypothetical protein